MRPFAFWLWATVALAMATGQAAEPQRTAPPRDGAPRPILGSGGLAGRVLRATDDVPLRHVRVRLTGAGVDRLVLTDTGGRFEFVGLPVGRFRLTAASPAYLDTSYGATRPEGQGASIAIGESEVIDDVVLHLHRGAVIDGMLRTEGGEPVPGVEISALRLEWTQTGLDRVITDGATTNYEGRYRIFGLPPGNYLVRAAIAGGAVEQIAAERMAALLDRGREPDPLPADERALFSYVPVYYPGTPSVAAAAPVILELEEELSGVDLTATLERTSTVSGIVTGSDGQPPAGVRIRLTQTEPGPVAAGLNPTAFSPREGTFTFNGVPPGEHVLTAWTESARAGEDRSGSHVESWSRTTLFVSGADLPGVAVNLQPALTVSGWVRADRAIENPPPLDAWVIGLYSLEGPRIQGLRVPAASVRQDGSFTIGGVMPGRYRLSASIGSRLPPGHGWAIQSAACGGRDCADIAMDVTAGTGRDDIDVVVSNRFAELSGTLFVPPHLSSSDYVILVFATESNFRGTPRRTAVARPASDGMYTVGPLPAGSYYVAAMTEIRDYEWLDPTLLESVVPAATLVTLVDGEVTTQDLAVR